MILSIDPSHAGAQELIERVQPDEATVSVSYDADAEPEKAQKLRVGEGHRVA